MKMLICGAAFLLLVGCYGTSGTSSEFRHSALRIRQMLEDKMRFGSTLTIHDIELAMVDTEIQASSEDETKIVSQLTLLRDMVQDGEKHPEIVNILEREDCSMLIQKELTGAEAVSKGIREVCLDAAQHQDERAKKIGLTTR